MGLENLYDYQYLADFLALNGPYFMIPVSFYSSNKFSFRF